MSIKIQGLSKIYGTQKAVNDISFNINKGEIVGFLGPNGAGKSTTMKMITGYLSADAGNVQVCGIDVATNPIATKKKIGYLPEANPLYYDMYVREYLVFIAGVHGISNITAAVETAIKLTGLTIESKKKIGQLSKGYKQRVGLAAALIHSPEVLVLDEPTSGLDPNQIIEIRNVIKEQGKDKTVLFSSHILQEVEAICNRIIIINKGKIVADDVLSKLTSGTKLSNKIVIELQERVSLDVFSGIDTPQRLSDTKWAFTTASPDLVRKQLMEIVLRHNLNIVSLVNESHTNLEDVFHSLTS
ncbi:gliding motility-associated ABC transporter ATP-binding subunit GldA [Parasediminibacterium sp. JCM 36343]|uniref:gliding motility-associated ABC transporter ATP-binding subunit GldA n=1 Tax=Parasediminibacterium sp. JCM 36343 TaxID=3374279 RepID=UPI00397B83FA